MITLRRFLGFVLFSLVSVSVTSLILHGCGQTQTSSGSVVPASKITGTVLVQASDATTAGVSPRSVRPLATAADGLSTTPLAGATVALKDALTGATLATTTAGADGTYTLDKPSGFTDGQYEIEATKTGATKTTVVSSIATIKANTGAEVPVNAGTSMQSSALKEQLSKKCGDLLERATTLSAADKAKLLEVMSQIIDIIPSIIGTVSSTNAPTLSYDKALSTKEIRKKQFEDMSTKIASEISGASDPALVSSYNTHLTSFKANATTLAEKSTYPAGLELPSGYSGFTMPPAFTFPSGCVFNYSPESNFLPSSLFAKLPTGSIFKSGFPMPPSGVTLPPNCRVTSGFTIPTGYASALPTGIYFDVGFSGLPPGAVMPPSSYFGSGFDLTKAVGGSAFSGSLRTAIGAAFAAGFTIPPAFAGSGFLPPSSVFSADVNMPPGIALPPGAAFGSGFIAPSTAILEAGFVVPVGFNAATGFTYSGVGGAISFAAGASIPAGTSVGSGVTVPSGVGVSAGVTLTPGSIIGAGAVVKSGVKLGTGVTVQAGANIQPGAVVQAGANLGAGLTIPSGVAVAPGATIPSGVAVAAGAIIQGQVNLQPGAFLQSGAVTPPEFAPPSGVTSGAVLPIGFTPAPPTM